MNLFDGIGKPIIVASHPRSGTHLTIDLLRKQFPACTSYKLPMQPLDRLYLGLEALSAPPAKSISEAQALKILKKSQRPIIKTHASASLSHLSKNKQHWQQWLAQEATMLYIVRDGRSVLCSLHLFMQSYDPTTRCSLSDFLRQTVNGKSRVKRWAHHVEQWSAYPNVHLIKFEDIFKQPRATVAKLSRILELEANYTEPFLPRPISSLWHGRWIRLTATKPESTAIIGYYKGQKPAKWKAAFNQADHDFFNAEAGNLIRRLGHLTSA